MIVEPYREVAAAIIVGTCGRILLQQRDQKPGLLYAGMIGLFGGHREGGESLIDCARRELHEEIGLLFPAERFELLVRLQATYMGGGGVNGEYYVVRDVPDLEGLVVTEGSPLIVAEAELPSLLGRMTPSASYVARLFIEAQRGQKPLVGG